MIRAKALAAGSERRAGYLPNWMFQRSAYSRRALCRHSLFIRGVAMFESDGTNEGDSMIVTYAVERLGDMQPELEALLPLHWREIARDQEIIKLDPDWPAYHALEAAGSFHAVVARSAGRMIGYHISFIRPHLHYRESLSAITDIYFVLPEYRRGRVGVELFKEVEKSWKARGVQKAFTGCKVAKDMQPLFERLGWKWIEKTFAKVL